MYSVTIWVQQQIYIVNTFSLRSANFIPHNNFPKKKLISTIIFHIFSVGFKGKVSRGKRGQGPIKDCHGSGWGAKPPENFLKYILSEVVYRNSETLFPYY